MTGTHTLEELKAKSGFKMRPDGIVETGTKDVQFWQVVGNGKYGTFGCSLSNDDKDVRTSK